MRRSYLVCNDASSGRTRSLEAVVPVEMTLGFEELAQPSLVETKLMWLDADCQIPTVRVSGGIQTAKQRDLVSKKRFGRKWNGNVGLGEQA